MFSIKRRNTLAWLAGASLLPRTWAAEKPWDLLIYCGITMIRPMTEIARLFEQREGVTISLAQGGSENLYQSARKTGVGEFYLPGEPSFYFEHEKEGLFVEKVTVGYNQMSLMVAKGNPKGVKADVRELLRKDLVVALGNAESGSVGKESKTLLDGLGLYPRIVRQAAFLSPDSRSLINALKQGEADLIMNWRAVGHFPDNAPKIDVIDLPESIAKPQPLYLILLKSARNPALARRFSRLASGPEGQAIFRKHGFLVGQ